MIPVWFVVLMVGLSLVVIEILNGGDTEKLPTPTVVPAADEPLPSGPGVHDKFSDIKGGPRL